MNDSDRVKSTAAKRKKNDTDTLKELASELAINHLRHSLSLKESSNIDTLDAIFKEQPLKRKKSQFTRTIFVIGAGASTNACSNVFPPGQKAIDLIEKYFEREKWPEGIKQKADKVETLINLPSMEEMRDFETRLFSLSHFFNKADVQHAIEQIYNHRTFPNLFYETLAHLLKNRFIDGIINFNFDELLDQAVEEEVGMGQLHKILSDGDCLDYTDMLVEDRLKVPFYIKPHGTITHKSSLLFTKEHYINIPSDIERLLEEILSGQPLNGGKVSKQFRQLNIITAGFHMESIEFNKVLRRSVKKLVANKIHVKIIYLSFSGREKDLKKVEKKIQKFCGKNVTIHTASLENFEVSNNRITGLASYLEGRYLDHFGLNLIDEIRDKFKEEYVPRDITRHVGLISFFQKQIANVNNSYHYNDFFFEKKHTNDGFHERKKQMFFESKEYYLERTIFEIINVVLKNNGYIQPKESLKGVNRVGLYFNLYIKKHRKNYADNGSQLSMESISTELSFYDILDALCLKSFLGEDNKEIFQGSFGKNPKKRDFENVLKKWIVDVQGLDVIKLPNEKYVKHEHLGNLKALCLDCLWKFKLSYENIYLYKKTNKKDTREAGPNAGDGLIKSESINLYPNYNDVQLNIISKIDSKNIVPTNLSLQYRYRSMFMNPDSGWDRLHIVSDKALATLKVLEDVKTKAIAYKKEKKIYMILSDTDLKDRIKTLVNGIENLSVIILEMPNYDHSRHMALFTGKRMKHARVLYYYKKGFSNNINAVYLEGISNRANINMLFQTFRQYLAKSIFYMASKTKKNGIAHLPHFTHKNQISKIITNSPKKYLNEVDKNHFENYDTRKVRP